MAAKNRIFLAALVVSLGLDQLTKAWIVSTIHYGSRKPVIEGFFQLTHVRNPGGAFSLFADGSVFARMTFFVGMTSVAVVLLLLFFRRLEPEARLVATAIGGILGGVLGNLTDRIRHLEVIDFLDFYIGQSHWPAFNLADSFIVVGVGVLLIETFFERDESSDAVVVPKPPAT